MNLLDAIRFDAHGLLPAIAQEDSSGRVLMLAWMNEEAFRRTIETGYAHYYSRSRRQLWKKGETSGHVQKVHDIYLDCDGDTILLKIEPAGPACHTNRASCFYRQRRGDGWTVIEAPLK